MLKTTKLNSILLTPDSGSDGNGGSDGGETNTNEGTSSSHSEESNDDGKSSENKSDVKGLTTIADIAKSVLDKAIVKEAKEDSSSEKSEESSILSSNSTDGKKKIDGEKEETIDTDGEKKEEVVEGEEKTEEADDGQLDKNPRFQEVVKQKSEYEAKVKEYEPLVEAHKSVVSFCQENQISEQQFQEGMQMLKLVNTDPIAARAALEPIWNQLNQVTGETLPGDLQQEVSDGLISEVRAKEIAKLRGQSQLSQARQKLTVQEQSKQQQATFQRYLSTSLDSWTAAKGQTDPKFKPKSGANTPDGKFEFVSDRFFRLISAKPPTTVAEAMQYIEQAYSDVSKGFAATAPKQTSSGKSISSTKSSTNLVTEPKSIKDVVANVLARHSA